MDVMIINYLGQLQLNDGSTEKVVSNRELQPSVPQPLFITRKLKPYDQRKLCYSMSASTNGPHITSGVHGEVTPKRGAFNNDRPLHYIDVNLGQDLVNCSGLLYVSNKVDSV